MLRYLLLLFGGLGWFVLFSIGDPDHIHFLPPCTFKALTGYPCPGCGMTHAAIALSKGYFFRAWQCNPMIYLLIFWGIYGFWILDHKKRSSKQLRIFWFLSGIALIFWFIWAIIRALS